MRLCALAAGEHLAVEQRVSPGFQLHLFRGDLVQVDAARGRAGFPDDLRVGVERRRFPVRQGRSRRAQKWAWRVAAQLGIMHTGGEAAWVR